MDIQYIIFFAILIFYVLRFISTQKKQQEEARRRQQQPPPADLPEETEAPEVPTTKPQPKTIEEILREMQRRVETESKPYSKPVTQHQPVAKPTPGKYVPKQRPVIQKKKEPTPFLTGESSPYEEGKEPRPEGYSVFKEKKEPTPFLAGEYSAYLIEEAKVPANMAEDFIRQGELGDVYNLPPKKPSQTNFDLRDAVVASVILNRLEW